MTWEIKVRKCPTGVRFSEKLVKALNQLIEKDVDLFKYNTNERTISQRLSLYLQRQFRKYNVDCEYNRYGYRVKRDEIPDEEWRVDLTSDDLEGTTIYPDIIVHKRGARGPNKLVIEMKKDANQSQAEKDKRKLERIKRKFEYEAALFINFGNQDQPILDVEWI